MAGEKYLDLCSKGLKEVVDQLSTIVEAVAKMGVVKQDDSNLEGHIAAMDSLKDETLNVINAAAAAKKRLTTYLATKQDADQE